jgi:hypothetical protein
MPNPLTERVDNVQVHLEGGPYDGKTVETKELTIFLRIWGSYDNGWHTYIQKSPESHNYTWVQNAKTSWLHLGL